MIKIQLTVRLSLVSISPVEASAITCHTSEDFLSETKISFAVPIHYFCRNKRPAGILFLIFPAGLSFASVFLREFFLLNFPDFR
jgi:hypothetical protein